MKVSVKIEKKRWLNDNIFSLDFILPKIQPLPGQFFQVRIDNSFDPFLNRPISVASYRRNRLLLVIKVAGKGTRILSEKKESEDLILFGPFGKGIKIRKRRSLLLAGGIGVAPLYFLAETLYRNGVDFTFLCGAKTPKDIILKKNILAMTKSAMFVTEKGGKKSETVISALRYIEIDDYEIAYTCGPKEMFKELKACEWKIPVYAFYEDFLGCGCGLCLGCAIKYYGNYYRICEDGPVFELKGIEFDG